MRRNMVIAILALLAFATSAQAQMDSPLLTVTEPNLGSWVFDGTHMPIQLETIPGALLSFSWVGDATQYNGTIQAYRYGWNIRDPNDDQQWDQNWSSTVLSAHPRSFVAGTQRLHVEVRDVVGTITTAVFQITINVVAVETVSWGELKRHYRE